MKTKPNISPEHLVQRRSKSEQLRPLLAAEVPGVREEWKQWASSLAGVVARHSKEIDQYIQTHGPMTRQEVVEKALAKLLSDV